MRVGGLILRMGEIMNFDSLMFMFTGINAYSCGPAPHALLYSIMAMTVLIAAGGVYVWRRFIRTKPVVVVAG